MAVEKNLEAFLSLDLPGTKVVVGDGPARAELERRYPRARFLGALTGEDLARVYASADVFVFPSLTDTFGIVLLEALASGLPIAAFPVTGPLDVIGASGCGILEWRPEARPPSRPSRIPKERCRAYGETFTWHESARQFFSNIETAHAERRSPRLHQEGGMRVEMLGLLSLERAGSRRGVRLDSDFGLAERDHRADAAFQVMAASGPCA